MLRTTALQSMVVLAALAVTLGQSVSPPVVAPMSTPDPTLAGVAATAGATPAPTVTPGPAATGTPLPASTATPVPVASEVPSPQPLPAARRLTVLNHAPHLALTSEQAVQVARDNDVVTANVGQIEEHLPRMRSVNPDLKALVYVNGAYAYAHEKDAFPGHWYARDADGRRVKQRQWRNFLMNPTKAWRLEVARRCLASITRDGFDGCAVDELGPEGVALTHVTGVPVRRSTGEPWTRGEWIEAMRRTADRVKAELGNRVVYVNGLVHGWYYFDAVEPTSRLVNTVDGARAEVWLRCRECPLRSKRSEEFWNKEVAFLADMERRGKAGLVAVEACPEGTAAEKEAVYSYALATFLMGAEGRSLFHFNRDCDWDSKVRPHPLRAEEQLLGAPLGPYARGADGLYRRPFAGGLVLANPSDERIDTTLAVPMTRLDGTEATAVHLPPGSGEILLFSRQSGPAGD